MSIFDPTTKALIALAQSMLLRQLDLVKSKHAADHKVVDAITAAEAAITGAVQALMSL